MTLQTTSAPSTTSNINIPTQIDRAEKNLQIMLEWSGRYDTRIAFVTGITIAMAGVLASAGAKVVVWATSIILTFVMATILILGSLIFIYFGQYPKTISLNASLIFFGSIAHLKSDEYQRSFKMQTDTEYLDDLLLQSHRNAQILNKKFVFFKISLILMLISAVPWIAALYLSGLYSS